MDIVILLSLSIFPHLHIRHTKFIGYSDNLAVKCIPPAISLYPLYTVPYQKYSYPTKYPCSDCAIYRLNIQFGAKTEIEIYRYQKFVVLTLTWVNFFYF